MRLVGQYWQKYNFPIHIHVLISQTCFFPAVQAVSAGLKKTNMCSAGPDLHIEITCSSLRYAGHAAARDIAFWPNLLPPLISTLCKLYLSLSLSPVSQKCPNVKFYNCYDWGLFWCKKDRKCQSLPHNSQPVSRTEDSRYAYRVVWGEVGADRGEVCPNKRLDRRQEHPQASHRAPPLCLHNTTGSTKMRQQLSDWDWD